MPISSNILGTKASQVSKMAIDHATKVREDFERELREKGPTTILEEYGNVLTITINKFLDGYKEGKSTDGPVFESLQEWTEHIKKELDIEHEAAQDRDSWNDLKTMVEQRVHQAASAIKGQIAETEPKKSEKKEEEMKMAEDYAKHIV